MSQISSCSRRSAATGALAALAALTVVPTASAATGTVDLQCSGGGATPRQVTVNVEYPSEAVVDQQATLLKITSVVPSPSILALAPKVNFLGRLYANLERVGAGTAKEISHTFAYPTVLTGGVRFNFPERGDWRQTPTRGEVSLRRFDETGKPIPWPYTGEEDSGDPGDPYTATISCTPAAGTESFKTTVTDPAEPTPPSTPGPLEFETLSPTSVRVSWAPSTVDEIPLKHYEVSVNGGAFASTGGTTPSYVVNGLDPARTYEIRVVAVDASGQKSDVRTGTYETAPVSLPTNFDLSGNASLKRLVRGSLPLRGAAALQVGEAGAVTGDLTLAPSTAQLSVLGTLPVKATVEFVPAAGVTGTLAEPTLSIETKARIKITSALLFGTIPLVSGSNCQTRQASTIKLGSTAFTRAAGGTLAGTFAISNLSGCGGLNGLVSAATAGTGNVIALKATPAVAASS